VAAPCPAGCSTCYSATFCTACALGYTLSNAQCVQSQSNQPVAAAGCPQGCASCNSGTSVCLSCISGYSLAGQDCLALEGSTAGSLMSIAVGTIIAIFVLIAVLILAIRYLKGKNQEAEHTSGVGMDSNLRLGEDNTSSKAVWHDRTVLGTSIKDCIVC
jgi:hypothetical protein